MANATVVLRLPRWRRERTEDGLGWRSVLDGYEDATLDVLVDMDGIGTALGERAARSKGKRASAVGGLVVVELRELRKVGGHA